MVPNCEAGNGT